MPAPPRYEMYQNAGHTGVNQSDIDTVRREGSKDKTVARETGCGFFRLRGRMDSEAEVRYVAEAIAEKFAKESGAAWFDYLDQAKTCIAAFEAIQNYRHLKADTAPVAEHFTRETLAITVDAVDVPADPTPPPATPTPPAESTPPPPPSQVTPPPEKAKAKGRKAA